MWDVIQGPQGDLARAAATPSSPFSSYLSARGPVPCHTAYCIFNSGSSSSCLSHFLTSSQSRTSSPSRVQQEAAHLFDVTNLTIQPVSHYEQLRLAQGLCLGHDFIPRVFVLSFFMPSSHSLSLSLSGTILVVQPRVSAHRRRDQSNLGLLISHFWGVLAQLSV